MIGLGAPKLRSIAKLSFGEGLRATKSGPDRLDAVAAVCGMLALTAVGAWLAAASPPDSAAEQSEADQRQAAIAYRQHLAERVRYRGGESLTAGYIGSPYTYASDVRVVRPGTDLTIHGVDWEGRPFDHPIYYGIRHVRWPTRGAAGVMVDFTHSKVYSPMGQRTTFSGQRDGKPMPQTSTVGEQFHKLEFTHGHNMLTLNGLYRLPLASAFLSPYVGMGAGVSLPHTEVQLKGEGTRTYEYQYTGPAVQALVGIELRMPYLSYFIEYKLTYANYRAPLHNRDGAWVIADLWHQVRRWISGAAPEGGWASTQLLSHQVIGGIGIRRSNLPAAPISP